MRNHPIPKRPLQSCSALAPTASRVAQFARDSANSWTPDVLFTSLLRAGPPSSRETAPIPRHLTHHLRHFCEAGPPSSPETMNSWTADPLFTSLLRAGSPSSRETAPILKPDLLFTSLLRGGSPSSRETAPILKHLTYYLRHFCEPGRLVREKQPQFWNT